MKDFIKKIFSITNTKNQSSVPIIKDDKEVILAFVKDNDLAKWLDKIEILGIGDEVYYFGYPNKLKIANIIGYSFKLCSNFEDKVDKPYCKLVYIVCRTNSWLNSIEEIPSDKAFKSRELLLMNIQAEILEPK